MLADGLPHVKIYTTRTCGYCRAAVKLLQDKGVRFENIDISLNNALREEMMRLSGRRTVPQVFIDDQSLGGYDDIAALNTNGELNSLLGLSPDTK